MFALPLADGKMTEDFVQNIHSEHTLASASTEFSARPRSRRAQERGSISPFLIIKLVPEDGFEPPTKGL